MVVEEEWLMETGGRMMEDRSVSCSMEYLDSQRRGMCKDDFYEDEVYVDYNFMEWLVS